MRLPPAGPMPLNNQPPTMNSQPRTTVGHENLRLLQWALDKPHPNRRFSSRQPQTTATNLMTEYS